MRTTEKKVITVEATINAPVEKVWKLWTEPEHITKWNNASEEWHTPKAENELRTGGKFLSRMEAKDGSAGFDFEGIYNEVEKNKLITYTIADGRQVNVRFTGNENTTTVSEAFEAENTFSIEMQQSGWQAILNNFKKYVESFKEMERLHFEIIINSSAEKVYKIMLDEKHFSTWTAEFNPGSHYQGSWEKGSKILFLGPDLQGNMGGMVSRIVENIPCKFVSVEHLGLVENGREVTSGKAIEGWAGALENYTFQENNGKTLLAVDMDSNQEFTAYFSETWPKALNKLKEICEA